jgi:hypothetical protein
MNARGALWSSLFWRVSNAAVTELIAPKLERDHYKIVRYEDFTSSPRETIEGIMELLEEPIDEQHLPREASVILRPTHDVTGNPARFEVGAVSIKPDTEWLARLPRGKRILVTAVCTGALRRFAYPTRSDGHR